MKAVVVERKMPRQDARTHCEYAGAATKRGWLLRNYAPTPDIHLPRHFEPLVDDSLFFVRTGQDSTATAAAA